MTEKEKTRALGPDDFGSFKTVKREIKAEHLFTTATVRLSQDDTARMIERAIRSQYNIGFDHTVKVSFLDPNRSDDAVDVVVERKLS